MTDKADAVARAGDVPTAPEQVGAVVNPTSGDGEGRTLARTFAARYGDGVDEEVTRGPDDVPRATRALAGEVDLLVSVGGDGTLREVASALYAWREETGREPPPLFVVPAGRGNSVYRHLYGEADWRALAARLGEGVVTRPLELTRVETEPPTDARYSVLGVTVGLFRHALDGAERFRALPGPLAYLLGTATATLFADPVAVRVGRSDERLFAGDARLVAVGGGRYRGGTTRLLPDSRPGDGCLHALVLEPVGGREALAIARAAREGNHLDHPAVHYFTGETFDVRAGAGTGSPDGTLPAEIDGTPLPDLTDLHCEVVPGALSVAYPASVAQGGR
ncbi:diacylglycerol/lipid kinase family protein [Haloglomus litoreum]|uniref:diacylglycerol/lipid kinase family protein n=1 Tax=Haloglomus litoreum TaxID=3034026 RepID=UPI0023E894A9|nr:diacylglycerol kinase family protein [Haloglomus sp. DT116]